MAGEGSKTCSVILRGMQLKGGCSGVEVNTLAIPAERGGKTKWEREVENVTNHGRINKEVYPSRKENGEGSIIEGVGPDL